MIKNSPIKNLFICEYSHLSNFIAPAMIAGILTSFSGFSFSNILLLILLLLTVSCCFYFSKSRPLCLIFTFFILGMGVASYRLEHTFSPTINHPFSSIEIEGKIEEISPLFNSQRLILSHIHFLNEFSEKEPLKIKLTDSVSSAPLAQGNIIRAKVSLRPPLSEATPYGYNEARHLYFQKIGAIGSIQEIISIDAKEIHQNDFIHKIRFKIKNRLQAILPTEIAQIATTLIIGEQKMISSQLYHLFQSAGVSHILSVSGFHMGLLALFIFFVIRSFLSFFPITSNSFSNKKVAAIIAFLCLTGYLLISGEHAPALRSYIMISILFLAILFDRNAFSIRSLSIAAVVILFFSPELIFDIGFQLSFTAVLVLISLYQPIHKFLFPNKPKNLIIRIIRFVISFMLVSFLVGITTLPLTIYHFNQYALYGVLGNALIAGLFSFWIMPFLFLALLFMPFSWDVLFLKVAGIGINTILSICHHIDHWPSALIYFPSFETTALILMLIGLILLLLMKTRLRFFGILFLFIGLWLAYKTPRPDLLVGDKGLTIAIRNKNETLKFIACSENPYTAQLWLLKNGEKPYSPTYLENQFSSLTIKGKRISFTSETCGSSDLCFLPTFNPIEKNALSLFDFKNRFIYINNNKISLWKP